jgi:hypothetical protein
MYAAYQIKDIELANEEFKAMGRSRAQNVSDQVRSSLDTFMTPDGRMDAAKMMEEWFPSRRFEVFISHARRDKHLAFALSGWLEHELGLTSFIDSCVWSHADRLQRELDEYSPIVPNVLYSYEDCRITAAHVNLMLATALTQMMDSCECVFFLNTANSVQSVSVEEMLNSPDGDSTHSPWLFHEISQIRLLRRRSRMEHRSIATKFLEEFRKTATASVPPFKYPANLDGVPVLDAVSLDMWRSQATAEKRQKASALDLLYDSIVSPQ